MAIPSANARGNLSLESYVSLPSGNARLSKMPSWPWRRRHEKEVTALSLKQELGPQAWGCGLWPA